MLLSRGNLHCIKTLFIHGWCCLTLCGGGGGWWRVSPRLGVTVVWPAVLPAVPGSGGSGGGGGTVSSLSPVMLADLTS